MTPDLHARITAAVAEARQRYGPIRSAWILRACDHADDVLARHFHRGRNIHGDPVCNACHAALVQYPCPEVRALADLWLGKGWDQ